MVLHKSCIIILARKLASQAYVQVFVRYLQVVFTPLTLPVDLRLLIKHLTGNVHAVAVVPDVAQITLGHLFAQACDRNIYGFGGLDCDSLALTLYGKT